MTGSLSSTERGEHTPGIVERLRAGPVWGDGSPIGSVVGEINGATMREAADLISELVGALEEVGACMLNGGDGVTGDFGWKISRLTKARPMIRAAIAKARGGAA